MLHNNKSRYIWVMISKIGSSTSSPTLFPLYLSTININLSINLLRSLYSGSYLVWETTSWLEKRGLSRQGIPKHGVSLDSGLSNQVALYNICILDSVLHYSIYIIMMIYCYTQFYVYVHVATCTPSVLLFLSQMAHYIIMHTITMLQSIISSLHHCIRNRPLFGTSRINCTWKKWQCPTGPGIHSYNAQTRTSPL